LSEKDIQKKVTEVLDPVLKMDGVSIPGMWIKKPQNSLFS
jgi:hypothetical protein